ncbi:Fe-S cluster assembly ATPase SufC [Candidatus Peregrinibacteria bacterium RIFCSPLOWO2_01_FULL_39_12]|nr:MAG: Fe-S cluster assembly ATPase SufC [Candidatus Peregrinibacteria bacterium RIFCSPLOWO2_02_FULL_39_10]OGJ42937.1 MAG: Fe-S cluster assembly ATPase SufC [Candidatus Peregrinibacteria bacterium RIFCSPLOWO2_01_FULL_39_12]
MDTLEIIALRAETNKTEILKGINLKIRSGEIHAIMGKNGSGKSTLCNVVMGHPKYKITEGKIKLNGKKIEKLPANKRANLGLFLAFQNPTEIQGVTLNNFLRLAKNTNAKAQNKKAKHISPSEFLQTISQSMDLLEMDKKLAGRSVNEGFSGGEKKRAEIMQMAVLKPRIALLDEIDSGLDIDALKTVAKAIKRLHKQTKCGILLITHYQRILNYITPDFVHIISNGKIIKSGDKKLAQKLEKHGYEKFVKEPA